MGNAHLFEAGEHVSAFDEEVSLLPSSERIVTERYLVDVSLDPVLGVSVVPSSIVRADIGSFWVSQHRHQVIIELEGGDDLE